MRSGRLSALRTSGRLSRNTTRSSDGRSTRRESGAVMAVHREGVCCLAYRSRADKGPRACAKVNACGPTKQKRRRRFRRRAYHEYPRELAPGYAAGRERARSIDLRRLLVRTAEQEVEEAAAVIVATAAAIHADRHAYRLGRGIRPPLDRDVGDFALAALEDGDHSGVAAVHIFAHLQLAIFVDEGGLVGQMDPDVLGEVDIDLVSAEHLLEFRLCVVLIRQYQRQQLFAVGERVLHAHAAVAVGAFFLGKQI